MGCNVIAWAASNPSTLISMLLGRSWFWFDSMAELQSRGDATGSYLNS